MKPWSERFPSRFLTVEDIRKAGGELRATVTGVKDETMQDIQNPGVQVSKAILVCDTCKPIVPGKLISKVLITAYGDEPLNCVGKVVVAFPYPYKGKDIVMLRCLVNGQDSGARPTNGPDPTELDDARDEVQRLKAELAAAQSKGSPKGGKKGRK